MLRPVTHRLQRNPRREQQRGVRGPQRANQYLRQLDMQNEVVKLPGYGAPTNHPRIESFSGSFRDACPNMNRFLSPEDARDKAERRRRNCNEFRPHGAAEYLMPTGSALKSDRAAIETSIPSHSGRATVR